MRIVLVDHRIGKLRRWESPRVSRGQRELVLRSLTRLRGFADFEGACSLFFNELDEKVFTTSGGAGDRGGGDFERRLGWQLELKLLDQQLEFRLRLGVAG